MVKNKITIFLDFESKEELNSYHTFKKRRRILKVYCLTEKEEAIENGSLQNSIFKEGLKNTEVVLLLKKNRKIKQNSEKIYYT